MKRILLAMAIAVLTLAGATAAWAQTAEDRDARRQAVRACVDEARAAHPDADRATLKPAVRSCLEAKGITVGERRARLGECLRQAKEAHPGDRPAIRGALRDCMRAG